MCAKLAMEVVEESVSIVDGVTVGAFRGLQLKSAFQPIFGIAQGQPVGFEGLLRATDSHGTAIPPDQVFKLAQNPEEVIYLDTLCRVIHARNFARMSDAHHWLFLNISLVALAEQLREYEAYVASVIRVCGIPANRVVVEVLESALRSDQDIFKAVGFYRDLGCLIAVDDFGAGHSNLARMWRLKPNIVKLDQVLIKHTAEDRIARMFFKRMVSTMHEAGSLVVVEGVELESEAVISMDANADFVQGFYFARPAPTLGLAPEDAGKFDALYGYFQRIAMLELHFRAETAPYLRALESAATKLQGGAPLAAAVTEFLDLPLAERCFLLNRAGRQIGPSVFSIAGESRVDPKYDPVTRIEGSYWGHQYFFRRAISSPSQVHLSRPYLSLQNAQQCVTVSVAVPKTQPEDVLCGDMQWIEHAASDLALP